MNVTALSQKNKFFRNSFSGELAYTLKRVNQRQYTEKIYHIFMKNPKTGSSQVKFWIFGTIKGIIFLVKKLF